ncbi:LacI family DNA-binding transcriptional regulator [Terriglobus roseus]|uniref:Transcriptional regulator, LacI family n=1 Tax=Terriglobus roseus TaxID=392734 RepID=A0A1G7IZG1_9BACT|nr:LacI family DNA-binding transcriptional regulator [Terriglobus roseus]SDF17689.1 transcriptional regulator, LacI family [Terriglobus roseus]
MSVTRKPDARKKNRSGRIKIQDVARLAQVSLSTVSGVLNEKDNIRPETRQRVLDVIAQLGYTPNMFASNLARRRTKLIGIIVSDLLNPFFAEIARALDIEARKHGYETFLASTNFNMEQQGEAVRQMLSLRVAGIAMMTSENDPEAFFQLKASGTPAVYLDNNHSAPTIGTVRVDKRHGMYVAVKHLLELGHRRILLIKNSQRDSNAPPMFSHMERQIGFEEALHQYNAADMDVHIIDEPGEPAAAGLSAVERALKHYRFTAVVAINDLVALGAFRALQAAGRTIPNDVSVVGFDDTYLCRFLHPPLTTVATPRNELAHSVLDMLFRYVDGEEHVNEPTLSANIVLRESTAPPAKE